jgi:hypothetical protein
VPCSGDAAALTTHPSHFDLPALDPALAPAIEDPNITLGEIVYCRRPRTRADDRYMLG